MLLLCLRRRAQRLTGRLVRSAADAHFQRPPPEPADLQRSFVVNATRLQSSHIVPLRKQLKDEARAKKAASVETRGKAKVKDVDPRLKDWELTVGIEIHAQLNTARKLFSCTSRRVKYSFMLIELCSCIYLYQCATE